MFQISTALTALNPSLNNHILGPILNNLKIHVINKVSINTKESVAAEVENTKPNYLFLSSNLPGVIKIEEVISKVKQYSPKTKVVLIVSDADQSKLISFVLQTDALVYAENIPDSIDLAIKQISKGQSFACGNTLNLLKGSIREFKQESNSASSGLLNLLTDREAEVLHSLSMGSNYKQISKTLFISESTVKTHINNIFTKLNVNDRTQAVLYALKHGIETVVKNPALVTNAIAQPVTAEQ